MISKAQIKFIKSLQIKKYRKQEQCFVVEGRKSVEELLRSDFDIHMLVATSTYLKSLPPPIKPIALTIEVSNNELESLGQFQTNEEVLAIAKMRAESVPKKAEKGFTLVLDDIRDPGNLGTIIRTADWYGIKTIIASQETADFYNPKVITASMGSFTRVRMYYAELAPFLSSTSFPIYGALLDGKDVHKTSFGKDGLIVIGNESNGISPEIEIMITERITIPRYGHAESLNAGVATAIILDNLRRNNK
jgi:TrmH family RNA methyltransferase